MKKNYVGNCVNSFDESGDCNIPQLPWGSVSDFAVSEEDAEIIDKKTFYSQVEVPESLKQIKKPEYLKMGEVYCLYDPETDIHHFFV